MKKESDGPTDATFETDCITVAVLQTIADREETSPTSLPPLYEHVDPDALDALFASTTSGRQRSGQIEFTYHGYCVTVVCDAGQPTSIELDAA